MWNDWQKLMTSQETRVKAVLYNGWCLFHSAFLMFLNLEVKEMDTKVMCVRTLVQYKDVDDSEKLDVEGMNHSMWRFHSSICVLPVCLISMPVFPSFTSVSKVVDLSKPNLNL